MSHDIGSMLKRSMNLLYVCFLLEFLNSSILSLILRILDFPGSSQLFNCACVSLSKEFLLQSGTYTKKEKYKDDAEKEQNNTNISMEIQVQKNKINVVQV